MHSLTIIVSKPKFTILLFNAGRTVVVDNVIFHLLISLCVPEILRVKVKSCPKSQQIIDVFCPPKFNRVLGGAPQKLYLHYHPHLKAHQLAKFYAAIFPTPEVITNKSCALANDKICHI